ncbi:MAG: GIY-YIG nuclease family protein [Bacillota bacterium]
MSDTPVFWVYILKCSDGSMYTGQTIDLSRRVALHNAGKGAIFTRGRRPVTLVYAEKTASRGDALRKEKEIRRLPKKAKELLLKTWNDKT